MALTLYYHPLSSFCWKVLIALYENDLAFEPCVINLGDPAARAEYQALWPTAKIPLLRDGERIVPETSMIIEHLDRHYPGKVPLLPEDPQERFEARLWDRLFDLHVMVPMQQFIAQQLRPEAERDPATLAKALADLRIAYDMVDTKVAGRTWAAGERFSMADCAAAPALFYAGIVSPFPAHGATLARYFERLMSRPSVQRAIVQARPYFQYFPLRDAIPPRFLAGGAGAATSSP